MKLKTLEIDIDFFSSLLFLFFIQQITLLIESIYMLNLLNTRMDMKALGLLLLALPVFLFSIQNNKFTYISLVGLMLVCMTLSPLLSTASRIFSAGIGAGTFLLYLGLHLSNKGSSKVDWGQSAAWATLVSILSRHVGGSLDISITGNSKIIGWMLVIIAALLFYFTVKDYREPDPIAHKKREERPPYYTWFSVLGLAGSILFIYFALSSPGVIARWTEGDHNTIRFVPAVSILIFIHLSRYFRSSHTKPRLSIALWNVLFVGFFIWNILLHRVTFPSLENLNPVTVGQEGLFDKVICYTALVLSPVVFVNISLFAHSIKFVKTSKLATPFLGGVLMMILCIFVLIFTNTWGYVGTIGRIFRNQFHLPFALAGLMMILPYFFTDPCNEKKTTRFKLNLGWVLSLVLFTTLSALIFLKRNKMVSTGQAHFNRLTLMTYNIQQGVDLFGAKNFDGQLAKIREVDPDILCLQESDASRISGGNSDVVRYFSEKLGYYSYYGPKTVTGTYGTAILSKFPLENCRTVFTYSSKDEIGTAIAEIAIRDLKIQIINSHPAGNETSRAEHIHMVISEARQNEYVIAMGDYNFRQDSPYYKKITKFLNDAWLRVYPDAIGQIDTNKIDPSIMRRKQSSGKLLNGGKIDMKTRIDHIFISDKFEVLEAHYLPAPESQTDHPLHWAVVRFFQ
ncbi:MAG: endonuclease/exonuclease/phosphatase family protein [Cytophagales bacterium]|nr:endonuclease/exonuclease/phosphatase family protein [Cytophagales bacterium]